MTPATWLDRCSWPGRGKPMARGPDAPPTRSGWPGTAAWDQGDAGRYVLAVRGRPAQREHPSRLDALRLTLVGHSRQPRVQAAADDALFRRLRVRPGQDPDRPLEHALSGGIAKLGAQREGVIRRHLKREDGTFRDSVVYSVLKDEWPGVKAG